jgi:hypothetical protein
MRKLLFLLAFLFVVSTASAQELNCTVEVNTSQIQSSDKKIFETLKTAVFEFVNNRKWTNDQFLNQERIECSILINITERVSADEFKATIQIQSRRPVFKSSYNSTLMNYLDNEFQFRYLEFQPLDFIDNTFTSNLTSVLAFYSYIVIGLDYDTFSPMSGTPYFQKAQNIVNTSQSAAEGGWKAFEGTKNRYWIVENLLSPYFMPLRSALYKFHRQGLDAMTENKETARAAITESLQTLKSVYDNKPGALLLQMFFNAKTDEIVNIYSTQATPEEKNKVYNVMSVIDPSNISKYQEILKGN